MNNIKLVMVVLLVASLFCHDQTPVISAMQAQNKELQAVVVKSLDNMVFANKSSTDTVNALRDELEAVKKKRLKPKSLVD